MEPGYVYLMANKRNGTIYTGCTSNISKRVYEHRNSLIKGFTDKYGCKMLVWFEAFDDIQLARTKELQMKEWQRKWKLKRIESMNPNWDDLYSLISG